MNVSLFFLFLSLFSGCLLADNFRSELVLSDMNIDEPCWSYADQKINESFDGAFADCVEKWNGKIAFIWNQLNYKVIQQLGISAVQIDNYLNSDMFAQTYINYYRHWLPEIIDNDPPQDIDPLVENFIRAKILYLQMFKETQINTKDMSLHMFTFGTDQHGHYIIFNENNYSAENIQSLYDQVAEHAPVFIIRPYTHSHQSAAIEMSHLIHFDITQAVSRIIHQSDFFEKMLQCLLHNDASLSDDVQQWSCQYVAFQSLLEAILQSKNPVEVAIFMQPQLDHYHYDYTCLFAEFLQDLKNCYNQDDLQAYQQFALSECRKDLYTSSEE